MRTIRKRHIDWIMEKELTDSQTRRFRRTPSTYPTICYGHGYKFTSTMSCATQGVSWLFDWSKSTRKMKSNLKKIHCLSCSWWEVDHKRRNKSSLIQPVAELVVVNSWKGSGVEKHEIHFKRGLVYPYIKWPEEFWRRYQKPFTREH